jgi:beta-galactosidase
MSGITRRALIQAGTLAAAASVGQARADAATSPVPFDASPQPDVRERLLLDFGWRFHLGHACDPSRDFGYGKDQATYAKSGTGIADAASPDFDDGDWRAIDLPHDWAVELAPVPGRDPAKDDSHAMHGSRPLGRLFPETSIGWYRRKFDLPSADSGSRLSLEFDGVFRNCMAMFNGFAVGRNESGYAPFRIDVTDFANRGGRNTLVLRLDATEGEGWFYEGAGIYRHVWLVKTDPLHIPQWGVSVRSMLNGTAAVIAVATEITNEGAATRSCLVVSTFLDAAGRAAARTISPAVTIPAGATHSVAQSVRIENAALWSPDAPNLYSLRTQIVSGAHVLDDMVTPFGVRSAHFDAENGFFLNGKPLKLKGTCNHQDFAGVGSALPDALLAARVAKLKEMGSNAYRCAHNPPAQELLDACDRLGMLVIDETRCMSSAEEGLSELARMVRRDRNHPSIILWSIGNEEHDLQGTETGGHVAQTMRGHILALDPTRPITAAIDDPKAWGLGITPALDVMGGNYRIDQLVEFHDRIPNTPLVCTEIASSVDTRGIYIPNLASGYVVAYDTEAPWWGSTHEAAWSLVANHPFLSGGFVWAGFDYRGEPTPQIEFPNNSSQCGLMDLCGFPKDNYFYYRAWWSDAPMLHLFPHWSWPGHERQAISVWCHTNLDRVELFLNGVSQGARDVMPNKHVEWSVRYAPGVLEARGWRGGRVVLTARRETVGAAAQIALGSDRAVIAADGEDVALVKAEIWDARGRLVPTAASMVTFEIYGPGRIIGVGNGDPRSLEPDKASQRSAFNGLCLAVVQAAKTPGVIMLRASAPDLPTASLMIDAQPARLRPAVS